MSRGEPSLRIAVQSLAIAVGVLAPWAAFGVEPSAAPVLPPSVDDRIVLSVDGSTLTGTNGGGGASAGWLHNFDPDTLGGLAVEHQALSSAQWTFASLNGSKTVDGAGARYSFYGEAHEGAGSDEAASFKYSTEAVGVIGSFFRKLSVQLEDKRIDILQSHGNLPKIGVSYQWTAHLASSVSYSDTVSGNLGTRFTGVRVDETGPTASYLAGVAFGTVSPAVLNVLNGALLASGSTLREAYAGFSVPFPHLRSDLSFVADYLHLSKTAAVGYGGFAIPVDSTRITLTLSYIVHVGKTS